MTTAKIPHDTVGTVPKSNGKIVEIKVKSTP